MESTPAPRHCRCSRFRSMRNWALWRATSSSATSEIVRIASVEAPASRRSRERSEIFRWSRLPSRRYRACPGDADSPVPASRCGGDDCRLARAGGSAGIDGHGLRRYDSDRARVEYDRAIAGHPFAAAAAAAAVCERCLDLAAVMLEAGRLRGSACPTTDPPFAE